MSWITKVLKCGTKILVRLVGSAIAMYCYKCACEKLHDKYHCKAGKDYFFCTACGKHN